MNVICRVCGGKDYTVEGGFYYCNECHTQTQELREEVYDYGERSFLNTNKIKIRQPESESKVKEKTWTTWEGYNVILKGLVDEFISLGAPSEFKLVTFQLWAAYLSAIKVAFFSKTNDTLPKLSAAFKMHDAQILYNFSRVKKKRSRSKSKSNTSIISSVSHSASFHEKRAVSRQRALNKRALVRADYESSRLNNLDTSQSEYSTTSRSASSMSSCSKRLKLNSQARKEKLRVLSRRHLREHCIEDLPCHKFTARSASRSYLGGPYHLSLTKLYSILYLALLITESDFYVGDILRYIREGHLSFANYKHLFPEDMAMDEKYQKLFEIQVKVFTHTTLRLGAAEVAKLIGVKFIPCPNIEKLCQRYVTELQLPDQIMSLIKDLLKIDRSIMEYKSNRRLIPNYEGRAMAYILFTLKIFFGINDCTEQNQSTLAKQLNKHFSGKTIDDTFISLSENSFRQFFDWNEWVEYIECRKIFIAEYHFATRVKYFPHYDDNAKLFLNFWQTQKSKYDYYEENKFNSKLFTFKKIFENLKAKSMEDDDCLVMEFPASVTPLKSMITKLIDVLDTNQIPCLLSQNYTNLDVDFLLNPSQFIARHELKAEIVEMPVKKYPLIQSWDFEPNTKTLDSQYVEFIIKSDNQTESLEKLSMSQIEVDQITNDLIENELRRISHVKTKTNRIIKFYDPITTYWIEPSVLTQEYKSGYFEHVFKKLPKTFRWLLNECVQITEMSDKMLYRELLIIEVHLGLYLPTNKQSKIRKRKTLYRLFKKSNSEW